MHFERRHTTYLCTQLDMQCENPICHLRHDALWMQAHNIPLQTSRSGPILSISGVGRWLDRGLSKLMGGSEVPPQSGPGSTGSAQSGDVDAHAASHKHRRNTSWSFSDQHVEV